MRKISVLSAIVLCFLVSACDSQTNPTPSETSAPSQALDSVDGTSLLAMSGAPTAEVIGRLAEIKAHYPSIETSIFAEELDRKYQIACEETCLIQERNQ
jgi:hypothetical protein